MFLKFINIKYMLKSIVLVILLLFINTLPAQTVSSVDIDNIITKTPQRETVLKYYTNIHKAERFILKENFKKASNAYFDAFEYIKNPFEMDLLNALECELLCKKSKDDRIGFIIKKIIEKTGEIPIVLSYNPYDAVFKDNELENLIANYEASIDSSFIKQIELLVNTDQDIRHKSMTEHNGYAYNEYYKDTIQYLDSINYYKIIELIKNQGYISEELIGGSNGWNKMFIIINHNNQRNALIPILHESVVAGTFDARIFAGILDICNYKFDNELYISQSIWFINEGIFFTGKYNNNTLAKINKRRSCIYLDSFNNYQDKISWSIMNPQYFFNFASVKYEMYLSDEEFYTLVLDYLSKKQNNTLLYFKNNEQEKRIINEAKEWDLQNKNTEKK